MKHCNETAVLVQTDIHYGKKTHTFNPEVAVQRLKDTFEKVSHITGYLGAAYRFDELVILMLGDINDGSGIYPTQSHHQAITNVEQQAEEFAGFYADLLARYGKRFPAIRIEAVPGNHGRAGKFAHEAANWDIVTYRYLAQECRARNLPVTLHLGRGSNLFVRTARIRKFDYLLFHGHQVRASFAGIPSYGLGQRICRWATTRKFRRFDMALCGHFHARFAWHVNRIPISVSGTYVTDDIWSLDELGWESSNIMPFFGVSDERPMTWNYDLNVAEDLV